MKVFTFLATLLASHLAFAQLANPVLGTWKLGEVLSIGSSGEVIMDVGEKQTTYTATCWGFFGDEIVISKSIPTEIKNEYKDASGAVDLTAGSLTLKKSFKKTVKKDGDYCTLELKKGSSIVYRLIGNDTMSYFDENKQIQSIKRVK